MTFHSVDIRIRRETRTDCEDRQALNKIVKLDEERRKRTNPSRPTTAERARPAKRPRWKPSRIRPSSIVLATIIALVALGGYLVATQDITAGLGPPITARASGSISVRFGICPDGLHRDCVVDGDTFWLGDQKIRIADIDTPELSPPRCEAERIKGETAKIRLLDLLNGGAFSLEAGDRDEDRYGRKLRRVVRDGQSIGEILISEGLARRWDGARHHWCD